MYKIDYHTHSLCSNDSTATLLELAAAAEGAGLRELCVTDHWNFLDQQGTPLPTVYDWTGSLAQLAEARRAFKGRVEIRLGLEVGNPMVDPQAADKGLEQRKLDFVIGSLHNESVAAGGLGFFSLTHRGPEDCYAALDNYFETMAELVELDSWDVLGHITYPLRYFPPEMGITLERHMERLEPILRRVVERGRGIEVNTTCGKTVDGWEPVLALYKQCGGELLTFGSDAHNPRWVAAGFDRAYEMARQAGFRYVTTYRHRKPKNHIL